MKVREITEAEKSVINTLWGGDTSIVEISKIIGVNSASVQRYVQKELPNRKSRILSHSRFTVDEKLGMVQMAVALVSYEDIAKKFNCTPSCVTYHIRASGVDFRELRSKKILAKHISGKIRPGLGRFGIKTPTQTPFQGVVTTRSQTEAVRAAQLDATGMAWFYELHGYRLPTGKSYLPDFWLTNIPVAIAQEKLGISPSTEDIKEFLEVTPHWIEDVKGWFGPTAWSWDKLHMFSPTCPHFSVLVLSQTKYAKHDHSRRIFSAVPDALEYQAIVGKPVASE